MLGSARRSLPVLALVPAVLLGAGCSRKFFRERADADVAGVITQKNQFPDWQVKNWHVYPDPRARFADPFNPDRPPYPPDDYAARSLSPNPQHPTKKSGVGRFDGDGYMALLAQWDAENRAEEQARAARGAPPGPPDRLVLPKPAYAPPSSAHKPPLAPRPPVPGTVVPAASRVPTPDPVFVAPSAPASPAPTPAPNDPVFTAPARPPAAPAVAPTAPVFVAPEPTFGPPAAKPDAATPNPTPADPTFTPAPVTPVFRPATPTTPTPKPPAPPTPPAIPATPSSPPEPDSATFKPAAKPAPPPATRVEPARPVVTPAAPAEPVFTAVAPARITPPAPITPSPAPKAEAGPWVVAKPRPVSPVAEMRNPIPADGARSKPAPPAAVPGAEQKPGPPAAVATPVPQTPPAPTLVPAAATQTPKLPELPTLPGPMPVPLPAAGQPQALPIPTAPVPNPQTPAPKPAPPAATDPRPLAAPEVKPPEPRVDAEPGKLPVPAPVPDPVAAADGPTGDRAADYLRALESNEHGYRIKLDQAVELGLINSREFQDRREDLYLAALPVTLQRFSFAAQAFATETIVRTSSGRNLTDAGDRWRFDTTTGFSKLFPTGANLLVQLANQVVIDLGAGKPTVAFSNFSLALTQPFFRGGGFAVTLEDLTQAERNMLYAIRSYARFRKIFYVAIAAGGGYTNNPYGLQGLSTNLGRGVGNNLTAPSIGFLQLLQQAAVIANQRKNVAELERLLRQYQAFREAGQIAPLQAGQVEVQLLNSQRVLLGGGGGNNPGIRQFLDSLDNYKLQLGLPLTVGLDLDASPLRPVREQLVRFEEVYAQTQQLELAARRFDPAAPVAQYRTRARQLLTDSDLVRGTRFAREFGARWDAWAKLTDDQLAARLEALRKDRKTVLDARADRQAKGQPEPQTEVRRLARAESEIDLGLFERALRVFESRPWLKAPPEERGGAQAAAFRDAFNAFYQVALEGRNERLNETREKWPKLPPLPVGGVDVLAAPLDEAYTAGIQTALSYRLDLMNARGLVVDAWRQIAVQANSLQGVLDVRYDLEATTPPGDNTPFAFSGSNTRNRLTVRGELPLVRRAERNNYRAALIGYQRQRRTLMAFEDNIANDVRNDIRQLRTLAEQYEIQQRVVELGYSQLDNARETQFAPLAAGNVLDPGSSAALTQQLLQAQSSLLSAQNDLFALWVSYQTARMNLYLDLELMQLDDRGVWCDEQVPGPGDPGRNPAPEQPPVERLPAPQPAGPSVRR